MTPVTASALSGKKAAPGSGDWQVSAMNNWAAGRAARADHALVAGGAGAGR